MRSLLVLFAASIILAFLPGCDYLDALSGKPSESRAWISKRGGVGVQLLKRGSRISGNLYVLNKDATRFQEFLCEGVYDSESESLLFPIHWRRGASLQQIRTEGKDYIEFDDLNFDAKKLVGKWRKKMDRPKHKRSFVLYNGFVPKRTHR